MTRKKPDHELAVLSGRYGGLKRSALYDGREVTAKARATFLASFIDGHACTVCAPVTLPATLAPAERERRAEALRKAHYAAIILKSVQVRQARQKS